MLTFHVWLWHRASCSNRSIAHLSRPCRWSRQTANMGSRTADSVRCIHKANPFFCTIHSGKYELFSDLSFAEGLVAQVLVSHLLKAVVFPQKKVVKTSLSSQALSSCPLSRQLARERSSAVSIHEGTVNVRTAFSIARLRPKAA